MPRQWPPPQYWQDFEEYCQVLYEAEYKPLQCQKYGRAGQAQHGVDIVALDALNGQWTGIQCKLKTEILGSKLTEEQLVDAYELSKKFALGLGKLIVATTCVTDRPVFDLAARVSNSFQKRYPVEVMFWEEFQTLLERHPSAAKRLYPEMVEPEERLVEVGEDLHATLTPGDWEATLESFFRHESFIAATGAKAKPLVTAISELIDNALSPAKGKAARVYLVLAGTSLSIRDDGGAFDPVGSAVVLDKHMQGLRAIRKVLSEAGSDVEYEYVPADRKRTRFHESKFKILVAGDVSSDPCRASGPTTYLLSRTAAFKFASEIPIPAECKEFTLRLVGSQYHFNSSASMTLLETLISRLGTRELKLEVDRSCQHLVPPLQDFARRYPQVSVSLS